MSSDNGLECEPPNGGMEPSAVTSEVDFCSKDEKLSEQTTLNDCTNREDSDAVLTTLTEQITLNDCTNRGDSDAVLTTFNFSYPKHLSPQVSEETCIKPMVEADGDLDVIHKDDSKKGVILIEHYSSCPKERREHQSCSSLDLVGEQVWRGAIFLGDFILHNPQIFKGCNVLELASGVGMTSIVAAMMAKQVVITDVDKGDILDMVDRNLIHNKDKIIADVKVKVLDFFNLRTVEDLIEDIHKTNVVLAADVVYHNQLTDGFFNAVLHILSEPPDKTLYVALEKRFVFTVENLETTCPLYDHFLTQLNWLWKQKQDSILWSIEQVDSESFPQYFSYERTKHLVLWKIQAKLK